MYWVLLVNAFFVIIGIASVVKAIQIKLKNEEPIFSKALLWGLNIIFCNVYFIFFALNLKTHNYRYPFIISAILWGVCAFTIKYMDSWKKKPIIKQSEATTDLPKS